MKKFEAIRRDELESAPVEIPAGDVVMKGDLALPHDVWGLVLFVHGSGSSRFSPRNRSVARAFHSAGLGTLLFDLLPEEEEGAGERRDLRFDLDLLAERLVAATRWIAPRASEQLLRCGYFGASTGAAAALLAAAAGEVNVAAIVSRGGRPDLAGPALRRVSVPTMLIVGSDDEPVLTLNRSAFADIPALKRLEIVGGATHLFEEPGTLEQAAHLALGWFRQHLNPAGGERK